MSPKTKKFVLEFTEISKKDIPLVGGKTANLGEMYNNLKDKGIRVPGGFAVTAFSYRYVLDKAGIKKHIKQILKGLDTHHVADLQKRGKAIRDLILKIKFPKEIEKEIIHHYHKLKLHDVAVRSSATAEDLPDASFAGQQETYLNVRGERNLIEAVKKCMASLFTNRAISYRTDKKFDHFKVELSVAVQKMVRSDSGAAGVIFTTETESGFSDLIVINSSYGLGEYVVKGVVTPDEFYVFETTLRQGFEAIIKRKLGAKEIKLIYSQDPKKPTINQKVAAKDQNQFSITDKDVLALARWAAQIEDHYSRPMDIEWAKDGQTGQLYILQARPETVHSIKNRSVLEEYKLKSRPKSDPVVEGTSVGSKIGSGQVNVIMDAKDMVKFKPGEVLVTDITDPDWEPIMKIASAIVTDKGGRTCHAAIVSRELGIPCIVGTQTASQKLKTGHGVTIDCSQGEEGYVYHEIIPFEIKKTNLKNLKRPSTKIMMNLAVPESAFAQSFIPNDGVGLAREEFIINSYIGIHPLALINYHTPKGKANLAKADIQKIEKLTQGYQNLPSGLSADKAGKAGKKQFFIDKLAEGVGQIAAAFYPKDVIVRLSDFKTNEYADLVGGTTYEPQESNPMIGWRGASRFYDPEFKPAFKLECLALRKVREEFGLDNLIIMVPFCRTVEEGKKVLAVMDEFGLGRGDMPIVRTKALGEKNLKRRVIKPLQVYVMVEIPSNVLLADHFAKIFDGFSIGSNDLTQLTLGLDRDAGALAFIGNEKDDAVKLLISLAIKAAKRNHIKIGICGQGPSDYPDFAQFLVKQGIDSMSLNPDTVIKTTLDIVKTEERLKRRNKKK